MNTTTTEPTVTVQVGDFFYTSWGYDQTNVDWYKVVGVTPSGKSVKVQKWTGALVGEGGGPQEYVVPGSEPATYTDWSAVTPDMDYWQQQDAKVEKPYPVETKRLRLGGYKGASFHVASYADAYLWDGTPQWQTGPGWGH